jgi:kynurenine formamidase
MSSQSGHAMPENEVRELLTQLSNWGRWGSEEQRGTLNFLTPEITAAAGRLVRDGVIVSCALPIVWDRLPDDPPGDGAERGFMTPLHFMMQSGEGIDPASETRTSIVDAFLIPGHGLGITHIDAPSHTIFRGTMYNGVSASFVRTRDGATRGSIEIVRNGIVGRGVLLDVPAVTGRPWLEDHEAVRRADLEACEHQAGTRVGSGDILMVRTGYRGRNPRGPATAAGAYPGLHADCLPWLYEREVSLLATDTATDVWPHGYQLGTPIHTVGMWAMGLWIIDNCALEELAAVCSARTRWAFQLVIAPLVLRNGTASPVNPLAVL